MNSEAPILKWTAAVVGVILVCFCVGYFVVGRNFQSNGSDNAAVTAPIATPTPVQVAANATPSDGGLIVSDVTDALAEKKKAEDAAKAKAALDAQKKAEDAAKKKAEEDAAAKAAIASGNPSADGGDASPAPTPDGTTPTAGGDTPVATPAPATPAPATLYRVRVGSFTTRDAAKSMASELRGRGYPSTVVSEGGGFRLQVGAYAERKGAESVQQELKANGYDDASVAE